MLQAGFSSSHSHVDRPAAGSAQQPQASRPMLRVALLMTALLVGCGQGGPKTYPVAGSVKIKGGTPLGDGTVQLLSEKYTGSGAIQPDGKFTISGLGNDSGVPEGTYKVVIITNEGGIGYGQKKGASSRLTRSTAIGRRQRWKRKSPVDRTTLSWIPRRTSRPRTRWLAPWGQSFAASPRLCCSG